jgi:hypothetical protein
MSRRLMTSAVITTTTGAVPASSISMAAIWELPA